MEEFDFYQNDGLPNYQRAVCGIKHIREEYILIDHESTQIWKSTDRKSITIALSNKSKKYFKKYRQFSEQRIWLIGTKKRDDSVWNYRNIASCCLNSFNIEINEHIKQLTGQVGLTTEKAKRYFKLWDDGVEKIAFFEILIDEYFKKLVVQNEINQDSYIFSIVRPTIEEKDQNILNILNKNRSSFIEGKLAAENQMKFDEKNNYGGIWFPSSTGIDGDIYNYYRELLPKNS